ncbi:hypothetical protein BLOT_012652 [Blomia tropicalis]|nr:hypothetical protein BLOT_012652 [Blomia tropicalis]
MDDESKLAHQFYDILPNVSSWPEAECMLPSNNRKKKDSNCRLSFYTLKAQTDKNKATTSTTLSTSC